MKPRRHWERMSAKNSTTPVHNKTCATGFKLPSSPEKNSAQMMPVLTNRSEDSSGHFAIRLMKSAYPSMAVTRTTAPNIPLSPAVPRPSSQSCLHWS